MALKMFIESSAKDTSKNFNYSIKDIINKYSKEKNTLKRVCIFG
jgi:hypothetical protein